MRWRNKSKTFWNISYKEQWQLIVSVEKEILEPKNIVIKKTKENRLILLSICADCGKKESRFIKNQELY